MRYALITPARDEAFNLPRIAASLEAQTVAPSAWVIVDDGSTDDTPAVAAEIAARLPWAQVLTLRTTGAVRRGGPVVRAFHAGLAELAERPDVVVKLDADVSMEPDHFERLLGAFAAEPALGMASGSEWAADGDGWRQVYGTRTSVWGPVRAYRRECLADVLPLEERMGWDGIDEFKANVRGWETRTLLDLPFRHHRKEGIRDGSRWSSWSKQGDVAWFMGYRMPYLLLKTAYRVRRERAALGILAGYARAAARRDPRIADPEVRAYLRGQQRLTALPQRRREALGR
jgi:poly-beta-1,6-N-acetyl-D-glucosamine synthase